MKNKIGAKKSSSKKSSDKKSGANKSRANKTGAEKKRQARGSSRRVVAQVSSEPTDPAVDWSHTAQAVPERAGATLYDPFGHTAYLADVRVGHSVARPEKLQLLAAVKKAGKLATGEPVKQVMLLVPTREDAVALVDLVHQGRVDAVVYPYEDKHHNKFMYDPNRLK